MTKLVLAAATVLCISMTGMVVATGQPADGGWGPSGGWGRGMMMGPGMMMGSGMMSWRGPGLCQDRMTQMAGWRLDRIERIVKPTDAQKPALEELRSALKTAGEDAAKNCPTEFPKTLPARLELMEKRMEAMTAAIKAVRPAFDKFYGTLDDKQKAAIDSAGPGRWGWGRGGRNR